MYRQQQDLYIYIPKQLNAEKRELQFFKNENDNLKRVLGIKNRDDYVSVYAKIIHEDTNEFAKNLTT